MTRDLSERETVEQICAWLRHDVKCMHTMARTAGERGEYAYAAAYAKDAGLLRVIADSIEAGNWRSAAGAAKEGE